jgi:site-specific recombinase XerD
MGRKTFRNKITSPELTRQINPKNIDLMKRFLKEKSTRTSDKTIVVYESNLTMFFTWNLLHNENKFFVDIKKLEFADFFSFAVDELRVGSSKSNNMRSVLSSLSNFIEKFYDEEYPMFRNVILRVVESSPKETRREKTILTDEQIEGLLDYLAANNKQQACWLALAVTSGARFTELLSFQLDMIDENRMAFGDLFLETTRQIKTKGRGKAGKLLYKYILREKFLPYYREWLKERSEILETKKEEHGFLFIKQDGKPATPATVRGWVEEFEGILKVPFYTHALRHYLTTMLSKKNIPYNLIKVIFGWEDISLVSVYDDSTPKDREYPELENLRNKL